MSEFNWNQIKLEDLDRKSFLKSYSVGCPELQGEQKKKVSKLDILSYWYVSSEYSTFIFIAVLAALHLLITTIFQFSTQAYEIGKFGGCKGTIEMYVLYGSVTIYGLIGCPIMLYRLKDVKDVYGIKSDIVTSVIVGMPCYLVFLGWKYIPFFKPIQEYFPSTMIIVLGLLSYHTFTIVLPIVRTFSKSKGLSRQTPNIPFSDILTDQTLLTKFRRYTLEEFTVENLLFYETCREFKEVHSSELHNVDMNIHALRIFAKFVKSGTMYQVNLLESTRKEIENQIRARQVTCNIFDQAMEEIYYLMHSWSYPRFLRTISRL